MKFDTLAVRMKIAYYRDLNELTQKQLATKLKKSINYISNLDRDVDNSSSLDLLSKLAEVLNISIDEFFSTNI